MEDKPDLFDLEQLRLNPGDRPAAKQSRKPPRHKPGEKFISGPVPTSWLAKAMRLTPSALSVGLALWFEVGCRKSHQVKPTWATWRLFGIPRRSAHRGLTSLEQAGLVEVSRHRGRCPVVTIPDALREA